LPNGESAKNEEAGWSQPSVGTFPPPALITATNFIFLEKKEVATLSMESKACHLIRALSIATNNSLLLL